MSVVEIYIFRHGETDWNKERRFQGHTDIPLNEEGRAQARVLALKMQKQTPQVILTSDLVRAHETAQIAGASLNIPILASPNLRECRLGDPEGWLRDDLIKVYGEEAWQRWLSVKAEDADFGFPNGENKREHLHRMRGHLESFIASNKEITKIAVSTHGGSLRRLVHHCEQAPLEPIPMPNCAFYKIYFNSQTGIWSYGEPLT